MKMGFTGTRAGMTEAQQKAFSELLAKLRPDSFHHGDCIGADAQAATIALGVSTVVCHPGPDDNFRAFTEATGGTRAPKRHFARNRDIVDETDVLVVCPKEMEWQANDGTWYTHDYALKRKAKIIIIWPDGRVQEGATSTPKSSWPPRLKKGKHAS